MRLIYILIISSTLLLSNSIVGTWAIDKTKITQAIERYSEDDTERFLISMVVMEMMEMEFKEGGSCKMSNKTREKCWDFNGNTFDIYGDKGEKSGTIQVLGTNHMNLYFQEKRNSKLLPIKFNRVKASSSISSQDIKNSILQIKFNKKEK